MFMRIAAETFGPVLMMEGRVFFGALALFIAGYYLKKILVMRRHLKHFFILGLINNALPFLLFAYAVQSLNASTMAVINSTAPIWGVIIAALWHKKRVTWQVMIGLAFGISGVVALMGINTILRAEGDLVPYLAGLGATFCYALASNYTLTAPKVSNYDNAQGSLWASVVIIFPLLPFFPWQHVPTVGQFGAVVTLGVLCTAIAYLIYFKLISEVGAPSALSVTFMIPVFGIIWGHVFLNEPLNAEIIFDATLIISGTMFITGFNPLRMFQRKGTQAG